MSVSSEISRLTTLRNNIRSKLIALGILSSASADLNACYTGINGITAKAAATITPGTSDQTIAAGTYLSGAQTIAGDPNLIAANIKAGVTIFGITGTYKWTAADAGNTGRVFVNTTATDTNNDGHVTHTARVTDPNNDGHIYVVAV